MQKPARYIGNEVNSIHKDHDAVKFRMALAFPDVYEVGMSHLGLKILYSILNSRQDIAAERVFAPWPDMEELMVREGVPLCSLESGTPLGEFQVVGFSLQYELCATTVLQMLQLGRIPLRAIDRSPDDPIVIGGGPVAFNPVPLEPFFDAFAIGDGEDLILELADCVLQRKQQQWSRQDMLSRLKEVEGMYVPSLHKPGERVRKRVAEDLNCADAPRDLVVPFCETVHDRVGVEIARGCTRGCRFCQAGMLYRPVREREPERILDILDSSLGETGWDEVALLSLSSGDYSCIGNLVETIVSEKAGQRVALSLPSLRTETFSPEIAEQIKRVRKTGFTLAPEAGTDRLRKTINKGNREEDIEKAVRAAFSAGWKGMKLYFMIGLPLETDEDLDGIVGLIRRSSKWSSGGRITASVSTFVPKSHTPFQWAAQLSLEETRRRQNYIGRYFRKRGARVKFHNARTSYLEGILARGDSRISRVIESAFRKGARFDGWDDRLEFDLWVEAFEEAGIDTESYLQPRDPNDPLPWEFVDTGVSPEYLRAEWEKAQIQESTEDCRFGDCTGCGVCDFERIEPKTAKPGTFEVQPSATADETEQEHLQIRRFRSKYTKSGLMRFLGHRDVIRVFHRAFRRAQLSLDYSKGFHPHPKLRFSLPLSVGIESAAEFVDSDLVNCTLGEEQIRRALSRALPDGFELVSLIEIDLNDPVISDRIRLVTYEFTSFEPLSSGNMGCKLQEFEASHTFEIVGQRRGKRRVRDLKEHIEHAAVSGNTLTLTFRVGPQGAVNPFDGAAAILGVPRDEVKAMKVVKTSVGFDTLA